MKKKILMVILVLLFLTISYFVFTFFQNKANQEAANAEVYKQAVSWKNPTEPQEETWKDGIVMKKDGGLWDIVAVDGAGEVKHTSWHAANIVLDKNQTIGNVLSLEVVHDREFDKESGKTVEGDLTLANKYNNAFLIGMSGWMPIPAVNGNKGKRIVLEYVARWPQGEKSYGSSGVWFEKQGTFGESGDMKIKFQSAGLSWLGLNSSMMQGFNIEGVTGMIPNAIKKVEVKNMSNWNSFRTTIEWKDKNTWLFTFTQNNNKKEEISVTPIGPLEVQLWKDNYRVTPELFQPYNINYENIPEGITDQFQVKYLKIYEEEVN